LNEADQFDSFLIIFTCMTEKQIWVTKASGEEEPFSVDKLTRPPLGRACSSCQLSVGPMTIASLLKNTLKAVEMKEA